LEKQSERGPSSNTCRSQAASLRLEGLRLWALWVFFAYSVIHRYHESPAPEPEQTPDEVRLEYQALELKRLKQELAEAKDQIREERRRYDQLQADWRTDREREQVLRQDLQRLMGQLDRRLSLAAPEADRMDKLEQDNRDLKTGVVSLVEYISKKRGQ